MALALSLAAGAALAQQFGDQGGQGVTKTCKTNCIGTQYPDTLNGTSNDNIIDGEGTKESPKFGDLIRGFGGDDHLNGDQGGDKVQGGSGQDTVNGDAGNDALFGGTGRDRINAGSGSDFVQAKDGYRDIIDCGSSRNDRFEFDRGLDLFTDCERNVG